MCLLFLDLDVMDVRWIVSLGFSCLEPARFPLLDKVDLYTPTRVLQRSCKIGERLKNRLDKRGDTYIDNLLKGTN